MSESPVSSAEVSFLKLDLCMHFDFVMLVGVVPCVILNTEWVSYRLHIYLHFL